MVLQSNMIPHSESRPNIRIEMESGARRVGNLLSVSFLAVGEIERLKIPKLTYSKRSDGLWKSTCLEVFIRPEKAHEKYCELNFSPSGEWAAYAFDGYRDKMHMAHFRNPIVNFEATVSTLHLWAEMRLPDIFSGVIDIGLSAVLEEKSGHKSYWALEHPEGKPDFHHPDSFVLKLPAS